MTSGQATSGQSMVRAILRADDTDSLVTRIAEDLALRIIDGRLAPGADLNSVDLAHRFNTSRTPVREALLLLEREGLVDVPARRRPSVLPLTVDQAREIYQVRAGLHALVSELIVARGPDLGVLDEWHRRLTEDAANGDVEGYFWHNVAFRQAEAELSGNRELAKLLASLGLRTLQLRHLSLALPGRLDRSVRDHDRLLAAYRDGDERLAVAITRSIIQTGLAAIEADQAGQSGQSGQTPPAASIAR